MLSGTKYSIIWQFQVIWLPKMIKNGTFNYLITNFTIKLVVPILHILCYVNQYEHNFNEKFIVVQ